MQKIVVLNVCSKAGNGNGRTDERTVFLVVRPFVNRIAGKNLLLLYN